MKRLLGLLIALTTAIVVAACGGGHTTTVTRTVTAPAPPSSVKAPAPSIYQPAPSSCPVGKSYMGCSTSTTGTTPPRLMLAPAPAGTKVPDVSNYQGRPNWPAAKAWGLKGAIFKIGESDNYIDSSASYNNAQLKTLGIPRAGYWFVRPVSCSAEGAKLEAEAKALGLTRVIADEEVAGISGYAQCLNPYARAATGHDLLVYRSAGNNYDSTLPSADCWVASYGPSKPPACSGRALKAWQFTDGRYGYPLYIPGVGTGDVSVDYGLIKLITGAKPKPKPKTLTQKLSLTRLDATVRHFGKDKAQERNTALTYLKAGCVRSLVHGKRTGRYVRKVCLSSVAHLQKLQKRLTNIHAHLHVPWSKPKKPSPMGGRNQVLHHLILGHRRTWASWAQLVKG